MNLPSYIDQQMNGVAVQVEIATDSFCIFTLAETGSNQLISRRNKRLFHDTVIYESKGWGTKVEVLDKSSKSTKYRISYN